MFTKQFRVLEELLDKEDEPFQFSNMQQNYQSIKSIVKSGLTFFGSYVSAQSGPSTT